MKLSDLQKVEEILCEKAMKSQMHKAEFMGVPAGLLSRTALLGVAAWLIDNADMLKHVKGSAETPAALVCPGHSATCRIIAVASPADYGPARPYCETHHKWCKPKGTNEH